MDNLLFDIGSPDKNVETATVIRVATSPFYRSTSRGIRVRTSVEFMFGLPWNACSACRGICVRFGVEYAAGCTQRTFYHHGIQSLTLDQGKALLAQDLLPVTNAINAADVVPLSQCRFDALAIFIYNVWRG
jgi:hypothetical protein